MLKVVDETFVKEDDVSTWDQIQACIEACELEGVQTGEFIILFENDDKGHVMSNYETMDNIVTALELAKTRIVMRLLSDE
jgi:hypothetical protein